MRSFLMILTCLFLGYSCYVDEINEGKESFFKLIGNELPEESLLSENEKEVIYKLCDSFQRNTITLSREKSPHYFFSIAEKRCDGEKSRTSVVNQVMKKKNGDFEFVSDSKNFYFRNVETHEQGMFKEMCRLLIFSPDRAQIKINDYADIPKRGERISYQIEQNSDDSVRVLIHHGKASDKNGKYKIFQVDYLNFLIAPRGKLGDGVLIERFYVKECPYGSLHRLTDYSSILERIVY